jgi:hypothetical protein
MAKGSSPDAAPDLLSLPARPEETPSPVAGDPVAPRLPHLLPKDLPGALRRLTDDELKKLFGASHAEMLRRNLMPEQLTEPSRTPASPTAQKKHRSFAVLKVSKTSVPPPVTQGKLNAIRAALKAGVKPNTIARQFGVTPAVIKKAAESS